MNKMINRYKSKEGGTMVPLRFQNGGSNLFLRMPDGGTVDPMGNFPMGLPEYQTGTNFGGVNEKTMQDFDHYYSNGFPMMQEGGDPNAEQEEEDDTSFYSDRMNTFIQKIRDAAEKNLETAVMEQDQQQPMAQYGRSMNSDPMNSYDPGNLNAFAKTSNYLNSLSQNAISGYVQRMGALGPNDYYYKEKNIYRDRPGVKKPTPPSQPPTSTYPQEPFRPNDPNYANNFGDDLLFTKRDGGALPRAKDGLTGVFAGAMDPELYRRALEMGHESIEDYKKSGWGYGKKHPQYKAPSYPSRVRINDPRTINATSGNPINPNVDLKSGDYHTGVIGEIARAAREYGIDPQELMSMGLQESNLGKTDPNYGHVLDYHDPQNRGAAYDMAFAKTEKNKVADEKGYTDDEVRRIQTYNGLGNVYPWTELDYHGKPMKSIYGVPLTNAGINMVDNPLYGKRIMDLRDNVLKNPQNAQYNQFLDKYNRDLANEEAISQQQIGAYDIFNSFGSQYGNQFRDMMQGAYSDSLDNSAGTEYIYPDGNLNLGYPVPNLDNSRQRNALDRFNRGIGYEQIPYRDGGALKKFTGDEDGSTTGDNYWSADEKAYLDALPKAERDAIISKGDKGREAYTAYRTANDKPKASQQSTTANNTGTTSTTANTEEDKMFTDKGYVKNPNGGWYKPNNLPKENGNNSTNENTTVINGVRYAVDPVTRQVLGYNPQASTGTQNYNNYNPYGGYNPYGAYGSMRGRNLGVISKNRLTKDFREKMLAGSYGNPQLLGVSNIETRRAMDPGNRIKSMTFSYNGNADNTANPSSSSNTTNTANSTNQKPGNTVGPNVSVNPSASNLTPEQKIQQAMDFTFRPGQGPYKPKVGPWDADANSSSNPSGYAYPTNDDSNIDPAKDPRGANYGKEDYPEDLVLTESGKVVRASDNNYYVKMPDGTIQKSMDREVLRRQTGFAKGGSLHRFIGKYQQDINSAQPGTVPNMDWSLPSAQEMMQNYMNSLYDNKLDLGVTDMFGKPMSHDFSTDKIDLGVKDLNGKPIVTDLSDLSRKMKNEDNDTNTAMGDGFDVETKTKKKKIRNPEKDLAAINFATNLFKSRDAAYADTEYRTRSQASNNFNPMRSTEGNYDILSGDFRRGKRAADGNDAFHSGFNTYAQMGGSMLENLKEGDEVYLTEDQINQIIKRGGKLSYL